MKGGGGYSRGRGERVGLGGHERDESARWELRLGYVKGKMVTSYLQFRLTKIRKWIQFIAILTMTRFIES